VHREEFKLGQYALQKSVQDKSAACPDDRLHSLKSFLRRTAGWTKWVLWSDSEDTPNSAVKHEGLLSPVEVIAWYATSATGAIYWNHFVV
jgi:hypothetical protein